MDLEFRHLTYFLAVVQEKSFNRAASRLHISQPTLSRQISDLECYLSVKLFERARTGVVVTQAGLSLVSHATKLLEAREQMLQSLRPQIVESLRIGYIAPSLFGRVGSAVGRLRQLHPDLDLQIIEAAPSRQIELLETKQLDIAFVGHCQSELSTDLMGNSLFPIPLAACLPATHRFAKEKEIALSALADERFLGLQEELFPGRQEVVTAACQRAGFEITFDQLADSLISLLVLIGHGQGVSLVPQDSLSIAHADVAFVPLAGESSQITFHAVTRREHRCALVETLLSLVREED